MGVCNPDEPQEIDEGSHFGSDSAYTLGTEEICGNMGGQPVSAGARATNVYRHEGGEWKMVHHHGDTLPQEVLQALMPQG